VKKKTGQRISPRFKKEELEVTLLIVESGGGDWKRTFAQIIIIQRKNNKNQSSFTKRIRRVAKECATKSTVTNERVYGD